MKVSVIIPILAHENHILAVEKAYLEVLARKYGEKAELIIVVNGDQSLSLKRQDMPIKKISGAPQVKEVRLRDRGWGRAILTGISLAEGEFIAFTNASYVSPEVVADMLKKAEENLGWGVVPVRQAREHWKRFVTSRVYNAEFKLFFGGDFRDINAAPKVFPESVIKHLPLQCLDSLFDAELFYWCLKRHIPIKQVPIAWGARIGGKTNTNWKTVWQLATGLPRLRLRLLFG